MQEAFLEREIEVRDIRIGKLEAIIILKDNVIANLKGGKKINKLNLKGVPTTMLVRIISLLVTLANQVSVSIFFSN